jgi:GNAT superfamily N-acetyltransferase
MTVEQIKVPFIWEEPKPRVIVPSRLLYRSLEEVGDEEFVIAIRLCLKESMDRRDLKLLQEMGEYNLARQSFEEIGSTFDYQRSWWCLAYTQDDDLVGFLQPVIFRGCRKDNLEEGTIYNYGVVPKHRGHGYGRDLLLKTTAILQNVGVWRIFADVDEINIPSLKTLFAVGYRNASADPECVGVDKWASKIRVVEDLPRR